MSNNKIGIMLEGFRKPLGESLQIASSIGADAIQLSLAVLGDAPLEMTSAHIKLIRDEIKSYSLSVSAFCGDLGGHGFTGLDDNRKKIDTSKKMADLALKLGTNIITTHIGVVPADKSGYYSNLISSCNELGKYAESLGAVFAIETGPETPEVLLSFINDLSYGGIGVNYDPANLVMVTDVDPVAGVYVLKDKIVHTHAKDGVMLQKTDPKIIYDFFADGGIGDLRLEDYFKELPIGSGNVDIPAWIGALKDIGYSGCLTIEREVGADPIKDISLAIQTLRELI